MANKKHIYFKSIIRNCLKFPEHKDKLEWIISDEIKVPVLKNMPLKYCQRLIDNYCREIKGLSARQEQFRSERLSKDIKVLDLYAFQNLNIKDIQRLYPIGNVQKRLKRVLKEGFYLRILYFCKLNKLKWLDEKIKNFLNSRSYDYEVDLYHHYSETEQITYQALKEEQKRLSKIFEGSNS